MDAIVPSYKRFRFPVEIISHCVWLYHRFPLSFREVEEMMRHCCVADDWLGAACADASSSPSGTSAEVQLHWVPLSP